MCSLKTSRLGNVIRHIREVHGIDDPNAQNATKDSNTGVKSNGKDKTTKSFKWITVENVGFWNTVVGREISKHKFTQT